MSLTLRWVGNGEEELDRVAETRVRCYSPGTADLQRHREIIRADPRAGAGDYLLAEDRGEAVGTATAISFTTWVRGAALPCQGVAYVGTIRTRRRSGGTGGEVGIATQVMRHTLAKAREREQVLSALMPFRASYYEHFGYGVVERLCDWTVPLAVLPHEPSPGVRFVDPADRAALSALHQRCVERGQCDMERSAARWQQIATRHRPEGFEVVDRPAEGGPATGAAFYTQFQANNKDHLRVEELLWEDAAGLRRMLGFFGSLRDQYSCAVFRLPADLPLQWLLRERQIPHRLVNHPAAEVKSYTRMQVRVLDHKRLLEAIQMPVEARGQAVVAIRECEGTVTRFRLTIEDGRASVAPTAATPDVAMPDTVWAAVALGELPAERAAALGLVEGGNPQAIGLLGCLAAGPLPFCQEYF